MPARQLHLLEPCKPLLKRFGTEFFSAAPRQPGVYIMTGKSERVLYIGQSGNLRARLGSYKNARLDCAPRKIVRLVHLVESITYETCSSPEAAILRESELLLLHRPKFNSMGVFPKKPKYLHMEVDEHGFALRFSTEESSDGSCHGPFKGDVLASFAALCRTLWTALYRPALEDFPIRLLTERPAKEVSFSCQNATNQAQAAPIITSLSEYLRGGSDELLTILATAMPAPDLLSPFQRALQAQDLETLRDLYARVRPNENGRSERPKMDLPVCRSNPGH